jgi:hypothetical protein
MGLGLLSQVAVTAFLAAKTQDFFGCVQDHAIALGKVNPAHRVFDHHIIHLTWRSVTAFSKMGLGIAQPGFKGAIENNTQNGKN